MINVLLIDDHSLVRSGIRQMLHEVEDIRIIGEAQNGLEGIQLSRELKPDVVILDFKLPDITGLEATSRLVRGESEVKVLVVSSAINDLFPLRILEAGASGYLTKACNKEELVRAIQTVYKGQHIISPEIARRLALAKVDNQLASEFNKLTDKEMEVMMMIIRGVETNEIASRLFLSIKTVHSYRSRIFEKLDLENEVALIFFAIKKGLITLEDTETVS